MQRGFILATALTVLLAACSEHTGSSGVGLTDSQKASSNRPGTTVIVYDDFQKPGGHTLADLRREMVARVGDVVRFINVSGGPHSVSALVDGRRVLGADAAAIR